MNIYKTTAFYPTLEPNNEDNKIADQKIIFGWPISSEATKEAGKLTFVVRFYNDNYILKE